MSEQPAGFAIGPAFWARLALVLPDPVDQLEWSRQGHDNEVGADLIENWADLFQIPDRDPVEWRRAVFPARAPFEMPGWVMYDARLLDGNVLELRRVEYVAVVGWSTNGNRRRRDRVTFLRDIHAEQPWTRPTAKLSGAKFTEARLSGAKLTEANLSGAYPSCGRLSFEPSRRPGATMSTLRVRTRHRGRRERSASPLG